MALPLTPSPGSIAAVVAVAVVVAIVVVVVVVAGADTRSPRSCPGSVLD